MYESAAVIADQPSHTGPPGYPGDLLPPSVVIGGVPWWNLRDILKAVAMRPFFIRRGMYSLEGLRRFLERSDKPEAWALLALMDAPAESPACGESVCGMASDRLCLER